MHNLLIFATFFFNHIAYKQRLQFEKRKEKHFFSTVFLINMVGIFCATCTAAGNSVLFAQQL